MDDLLGMFSQISTDDHTAMSQQFARVMHCDPQFSQFFLESSNWNVEMAINAFLSTAGSQEAVYQQSSPPQAVLHTDLSQLQSVQFPPLTPIQLVLTFQNTGQDRWPVDSQLIFVDGERMGGPDYRQVHQAAPGEQVNLDVQLVTPAEAGVHAGTWRLTCGSGYFSDPLWLVFTVLDSAGEEMTDALSKFSVGINNQRQHQPEVSPFQSQMSEQTQPMPIQQIPAFNGALQQPKFSFQPSAGHITPQQPCSFQQGQSSSQTVDQGQMDM
jgi:hypothetical protein